MKNIEIRGFIELNSKELQSIDGGNELTEAIVSGIGWFGAAFQDGASWLMRHQATEPLLSYY